VRLLLKDFSCRRPVYHRGKRKWLSH